MTLQNPKTKKECDIRFEKTNFKCSCGYEGEETILVGNSIGILDTKCPKCGKRILEFKNIEEND